MHLVPHRPLQYQTRALSRFQLIIAIQCWRCLAVMPFNSLNDQPVYSDEIKS
jgi:hypothetical protein